MKKLLLLCVVGISSLFASIGEVMVVRGDATLIRAGVDSAVAKGTTLEEHDEIRTSKTAKLQIKFNDDTIISLGKNSHFKIDEYLFSDKQVSAKFSVGKGFFKSITGKIGKIAPKKFRVKTANATIGVRGTTFIGEVTDKRDIIACSAGQIVVTNEKGSMIVNAGERTIVEEMKSPKQSQKINTVLLKQFSQKTNPAVVEKKPATEKQTLVVEKKREIKSIDDEKTSDKFEPWDEEGQGVNTLEDIENVLGEQNPTYSGKVTEGSTSFGAIDKDSSDVQLGFDLGTGDMDGQVNFKDTADHTYDVDVAGKIKGDGSFNFNSTTGYNGQGDGRLSGENLEDAKGDFAFTEELIGSDSKNEMTGKFEATHNK